MTHALRRLAALALLLAALPALASEPTPALQVVRLKPAASRETETVTALLRRISDKTTDEVDDRKDFERIVAMRERAVAALGEVLRDPDARYDNRWVAARALGRIGGEAALKSLRSALAEDRFSMIRLAAIHGLKDLNDAASLDAFVKALGDEAMVVRSAAADALGVLGDARAAPALIAALDREDNFYRGRSLWVRRHVVSALGAIQSRTALPVLIKALDDPDPSVGREAVASLERLTQVLPRPPTEKTAASWKSWWEANKKDYL